MIMYFYNVWNPHVFYKMISPPPTLSPQPQICKEYLDPHIDKYICDADMGTLKKATSKSLYRIG